MVSNIFKGAKFGDKFLTRDGRTATYSGACLNNHHYILIDGETACLSVLYNGSSVNNTFDSPDDIVSHYKEPIDEEKLDELARTLYQEKTYLEFPTEDRVRYFKAGYRKAKEE